MDLPHVGMDEPQLLHSGARIDRTLALLVELGRRRRQDLDDEIGCAVRAVVLQDAEALVRNEKQVRLHDVVIAEVDAEGSDVHLSEAF